MDNQKKIAEKYFDIDSGLRGTKNIYKKLDKNIKQKEIKETLKNVKYNQTQQQQQPDKSMQIPITAPKHSYQCDLTFYEQYKTVNNKCIGLMTIIDINTRYGYAYPIKSKASLEISKILQKFLDEEKQIYLIEFDDGNEFNNKIVIDQLQKRNIQYKFFNKQVSKYALQMVERFNRTIRDMITKYMEGYDTHKYIDVIHRLVNNYNNQEHSGIKMSPQEAKSKDYEDNKKKEQKAETIYNIGEKFEIGDDVYLYRGKKLFEKGNKTYYKSKYTIVDKEGNGYVIEKGDGKRKVVMPYQLKKYEKPIENPYLKKDQTNNKVDKKELKKEKKQTRTLKREGIYQEVQQQQNQQKQNKKLKRMLGNNYKQQEINKQKKI